MYVFNTLICVYIAALPGTTMLEAARVFGWSAWSGADSNAKSVS